MDNREKTVINFISSIDRENLMELALYCDSIAFRGYALAERSEMTDCATASVFFEERLDDYIKLQKLKKAELVKLAPPSGKKLMNMRKEQLIDYVLNNITDIAIEYIHSVVMLTAADGYADLLPMMRRYAIQIYFDYVTKKK